MPSDSSDFISIIDELPLWSAPFGLRLLETVRMRDVRRVLDIGSGLGFPVCEIAMRFGSGVDVYALDPWAEALERLAMKRRLYGIGNLAIIRGEAERLPFPDGRFDLLVSNNGINNVRDLAATVAECRRVAAPGAQFVFTMNLDDTMREFYTVYEDVLRSRSMQREIRAMRAHIHAKRPPIDVVTAAVERAGFRIAGIELDRFRYRFRDGTAMLRHFLITLAFIDAWQEFLPPEKKEIIFSEIEDRLNRVAQERGELQLGIPFAIFDCTA